MTDSNNPQKYNVYPYVLCALFAALTAAFTFINIPLPFTPIPINLATLSVFLSGGLLGAKYGALSQLVYVMVGCIGVPVFSNYQGGAGVLVGPTGGFLAGYIVGSFVIGLILGKILKQDTNQKKATVLIVIACLAGMATYFTLGTIWFMYITNTGVIAALLSCVVPFLIGDALKIVAATFLILKLRKQTTFFIKLPKAS